MAEEKIVVNLCDHGDGIHIIGPANVVPTRVRVNLLLEFYIGVTDTAE